MLWPCVSNSSVTTATDRLLVLLDRDRVLDRERRARSARAEPDDRAVDAAGELVDVLAVVGAGLADLRAGLDQRSSCAPSRGGTRPRCSRSAATIATPVGADADVQAGERPLEAERRCAHLAGGRGGRPADPDRVVLLMGDSYAIYAPAYNMALEHR